MNFIQFRTIKLATAPSGGDNPPSGRVYEWNTIDGLKVITNYRLSDGTNITSGTSNRNFLINSGFNFFQRTAPGTLTAISDDAYGADRWVILVQTASVQIQRTTGDTYSVNAVDIKQNQAAAQRFGVEQILENTDSKGLRGRSVIFQARVKCSSSQAIRIAILEWTGTADAVTSDVVRDWTSGIYTANNFFLTSSLTVTAVSSITPSAATWTSLSVTGTISSSCNNLIAFIWTEGTAAQNVTLDVTETGVYLDTSARTWEPRSASEELLLCQRFYEKSYEIDTPPGTALAAGWNGTAISAMMTVWIVYSPAVMYQVVKRVSGTPTYYSPYSGTSGYLAEHNVGSTYVADRAIISLDATSKYCSIQAAAGTFTVGNWGRWHWVMSAEL